MSMRMVFWGCCAMAVAVAGGVYYAAEYSCRHPHSFVARCAHCAVEIGLECCPAHKAVSHVRTVEKSVPVALEQPATEVGEVPAIEPQEVIDLTQIGVGSGPKTVDEGVEHAFVPIEQKAEAAWMGRDGSVIPVVVPPTEIEESEPSQATEPPIAKDDDVPDRMPPCEDEAPAAKSVSSIPAMEESTLEEDDVWYFYGENEVTEAPEALPMPKESRSEPEALPVPKESRPDPEAKPSNDSGAEESEPKVQGGKPADCRMDPCYEQEYPSCPHMSGCPRSPASTPEAVSSGAEKRAPKKKKVKKDKAQTEEQVAPPSIDEDVPQEPSVDTMEFRKSDAKKGEFKKRVW